MAIGISYLTNYATAMIIKLPQHLVAANKTEGIKFKHADSPFAGEAIINRP